ncbi:MAG: pyrroloquinoline quinone-dependent dehydrogenase [Acidobacteriaceae bacterium]
MPAKSVFVITFLLLAVSASTEETQKAPGWSTYNGDLAGQHYSPLRQIDRLNVKNLKVAWTFHTGVFKMPGVANSRAAFEDNPIFWRNRLYITTPFDQVFALDAESGKEIWSFDPKINRNATIGIVTSRGVSIWHTRKRRNKMRPCEDRVFVATLDARLFAIDAITGRACGDFGIHGFVDLTESLHLQDRTWYEFTSPPTVVGNTVILGSSVGDNQSVEEPSGAVRGFDALSGKLLWSWEPLPWAQHQHPRTGAGNAWSVIAADPKHGLIYVPTGSPSPDFYGVYRPGDNRDADSVVALQAATGKRVWGFQVVHHDLWDYDIAAEPVLFEFRGRIPAVAITTKTGMIFVLNRLTGQPLYPVYEKPVPQSRVPGERTSSTQPFSSLPNLVPLTFTASQVSGENEKGKEFCRKKVAALVNQGIFTPVSTDSTLLYPGSIGGVEWGSPAVDPRSDIMYVNANSLAFDIRLVPRTVSGNGLFARIDRKFRKWMLYWTPASKLPADQRFQAPDTAGHELSEQAGTPYRIFREPLVGPDGFPCTPQPWSSIVAMNLNTGMKLWSVPLGTMIAGQHTGSVTSGGPIVTGSGLIFSASGSDPFLRAFDPVTGRELWRGALAGPANATPMTYAWRGRQYVVVAEGGDGKRGRGQALVAFALPETAVDRRRRPGYPP